MSRIEVYQGDCLEVMRHFPDNHFDAIIQDPPYNLSFMGKAWDSRTPREFQEWCESWSREQLRILKPGGHQLSFGGTRTYHRLACGIEDSGFEVMDSIHWYHGSGMPKSRGLLRPLHEPIILARKPPIGTLRANFEQWGTGYLNTDLCRVPRNIEISTHSHREHGKGIGDPDYGTFAAEGTHQSEGQKQGSLPGNVILTHNFDCQGACTPGCPILLLDTQSGHLKSGKDCIRQMSGSDRNGNTGSAYGQMNRPAGTIEATYGDEGGASRFMSIMNYAEDDFLFPPPTFYCGKAPRSEKGLFNNHVSVKPLALMTHLIRLASRPGALILDAFAGTATTLIAAKREGVNAIGIEQDPGYIEIMRKRLET